MYTFSFFFFFFLHFEFVLLLLCFVSFCFFLLLIFQADTSLFLFHLIVENLILLILLIIMIIIPCSGMFRNVPGFIDSHLPSISKFKFSFVTNFCDNDRCFNLPSHQSS